MKERLATVIWWVGAVFCFLGAALGITLAIIGLPGYLAPLLIGSILAYLSACALSYILSGSFWRPPTK